MNKVGNQYTLNLVHILQNFSVIFCLENSGMLKEGLIDLDNLEKSIKLNTKLFDKVLEDSNTDFNLKQAIKAHNQVLDCFQIISSHYNNAVSDKRQFELLVGFKTQLEDQIEMLEASMSSSD